MEPLEILGKTRTPDGKELVLCAWGKDFEIRIDGLELMANGAFDSEQALATEVCSRLTLKNPHLLIGGLGMGYTLRAALDALGPEARIRVAEVFEPVVEWNRGPLAHLSDRALDDPRVEIVVADVAHVIEQAEDDYDAILLDVDNGPEGLVIDRNDRLYDHQGVFKCRRALRPGGILAVWSSSSARHFEQRLEDCDFRVQHLRVRAHEDHRTHHSLYLGQRD